MRLYSITNMYMSGIHAGIQTQHSTVELFVKYPMSNSRTSYQATQIFDWAKNHKTTVILNGGSHDSLQEIHGNMHMWASDEPTEALPFAPFFEPGVNDALTSISIIMPQTAIDYMSSIRSTKKGTPDYEELYAEMYISYGHRGIQVLEDIAFLPLAK